jgi:hypothetical protein
VLAVGEHQLGVGILERLPELGLGSGERERNHHPTRAPHPEHRGEPPESRGDEHGDPRLGEVAPAAQQRGRCARGRREQVLVCRGAFRGDQRDGVGTRARLIEEGRAQFT